MDWPQQEPEPLKLSPQQKEVHDLLRENSDDSYDLASWYLGCLQCLRDRGPDYLARAAHSIREITDKLPEQLGIPPFQPEVPKLRQAVEAILTVRDRDYLSGWEGKTINARLAEALDAVESLREPLRRPPRKGRLRQALAAQDPFRDLLPAQNESNVNSQMKRLVGFFESACHHSSVTTHGDFLDHLVRFESVLRVYLGAVTAEQQREIRALIDSPPSPDAMRKLSDLLRHSGSNVLYFLENLGDPSWLPFLPEQRYFEEPWIQETTKEGRTYFRVHPVLTCLARLAPLAQEETMRVLEGLRWDSPRAITHQVLRCLVAVEEPSLQPRRMKLAKRLVRGDLGRHRPYLEELLGSLMRQDQHEDTIDLLHAYSRSIVTREPSLSLDQGTAYDLRKLDQRFSDPLGKIAPLKVARSCASNLGAYAEEYRRWAESQPPSESEDIFAPSFRPGYPDTYGLQDVRRLGMDRGDPVAVLARRLYECGAFLLQGGMLSEFRQWDQFLREHQWELFHRIRWQVYADHPNATLEFARKDVLHRLPGIGRDENRHGYEFAQMLLAHGSTHGPAFLSPAEVDQFTAAVFARPTTQEGPVAVDDPSGQRFHFHQLRPILPLLNEPIRDSIENEITRRGIEGLEDYMPYRVGPCGMVTERSPFTLAELDALPDPDLFRILNEWQPGHWRHEDDGFVEDTPRRLAGVFYDLLVKHPERFPAGNQWWTQIRRPAILARIIERATPDPSRREAEGEPAASPGWDVLFGIADHILAQSPATAESPEEQASEDSCKHPDWWSGRMAVARLLGGALDAQRPIPLEFEDQVRSLLTALVEGPDSYLDRHSSNRSCDWQFLAINSVRGTALGAVLELALRMKTSQEGAPGAIARWIPHLLLSRLDPSCPESPAIFALVGSRLRLCAFLFPDELRQHQEWLLGLDRPEHRGALIASHLSYDQAASQVLAILPRFLDAALDDLERQAGRDEQKGAAAKDAETRGRLGFQIAFFIWNGLLPNPEDGPRLLDRFHSLASPAARGHLILNIGSVFGKATASEETSAIARRASEIVGSRLNDIEGILNASPGQIADYRDELGHIADLIAIECFDFGWRVETATRTLMLLSEPPRAYQFLDTLESWGCDPDRLPAACRLLRLLTSHFSDELRWSIQARRLRPLLRNGLAHADPDVRRDATQAQENLLRHGFFEVLDLDESLANENEH